MQYMLDVVAGAGRESDTSAAREPGILKGRAKRERMAATVVTLAMRASAAEEAVEDEEDSGAEEPRREGPRPLLNAAAASSARWARRMLITHL